MIWLSVYWLSLITQITLFIVFGCVVKYGMELLMKYSTWIKHVFSVFPWSGCWHPVEFATSFIREGYWCLDGCLYNVRLHGSTWVHVCELSLEKKTSLGNSGPISNSGHQNGGYFADSAAPKREMDWFNKTQPAFNVLRGAAINYDLKQHRRSQRAEWGVVHVRAFSENIWQFAQYFR